MPLTEIKPYKLIFFGGSEFSLPTLNALTQSTDIISLVVTPPPACKGRGKKMCDSPVGERAKELGLPLLETGDFKNQKHIELIESLQPDLLIVVAYRGFLPSRLLALGRTRPLNAHPSLLPKHRGAAPINWAVVQGDQELGLSIIYLEKEMDAGPIVRQLSIPLTGREKAWELEAQLADLAAGEMLQAIEEIKTGTVTAHEQDPQLATVNPLLSKKDGLINFAESARSIIGRINGLDPWPGAYAYLGGKMVKFFGAGLLEDAGNEAPLGSILGLGPDKSLLIKAKDAIVAVSELQLEGKKIIPAANFWHNCRAALQATGGRFEQSASPEQTFVCEC